MNALPEGWKTVRLRDIASSFQNGIGKKKEQYGAGEKVANISDLYESHLFEPVKYSLLNVSEKEISKYQLKRGDLLFVRSSVKRSGVAVCSAYDSDERCLFSSFMIRVRPDKKRVDPAYLARFLRTPISRQRLIAASNTSTITNITQAGLERIPIALPPLSEQRRIVSILDKADGIRRKKQEMLRLTDELLRSVFLEMFGDPVTNPKGWPMTTVGEITSHIKDGPHVSPKYSDTGFPILSTRNIRPGRLILEQVKYVSQSVYTELTKRFEPCKGDVLLTKGGTTGFAKIVDFEWKFAVWVHLAVLRPSECVVPEYLESALNSPNCYAQSQHYTRGIANKDLGLKRIRRIQLALPPLSLQLKFKYVRQRIVSLCSRSEENSPSYSNLFDCLSQKAFSSRRQKTEVI